jgi:hypothetical protein
MSERNFLNKLGADPDDLKELTSLLKSYAIGTSPGVQLPTGVYLREIKDILTVSSVKAKDIAEEYKQKFFKPSDVNISRRSALYMGMYNAVLDLGDTVKLSDLKKKVEEKGLKVDTVNGYNIKGLKFTARYGRFKPVYQYTEEYGPRNLKNIPDSQVSAVEFTARVKKGSTAQGASFTIFKSGRVRFSGGYLEGDAREPKALIKYVDSIVELGLSNKPYTINNITTELKIAAKIDLAQIYETFDVSGKLAKFEGYSVSVVYEPSRNALLNRQRKDSPFLYVKFSKDDNSDKFTLLLSENGSMLTEGVQNMGTAARVGGKFIEFMKAAGILKAAASPPNLTSSPKPTKIARRLNMKPAPDVTRRGTTCPKEKRPTPYSFQGECPGGNKEYVRPNPQGQPCCYRIPKRADYLKDKVANRYARANVKIPTRVRQVFGIAASSENKANNVGRAAPTNLKFFFNSSIGKNKKNPVGFKIGSRQCLRYSKVALVDIAMRMGISEPSRLSKPELCDAIANKVKGKNSNVTAKVSGKRVVNVGNGLPVVGKDKKLRLGNRLCESLKKEDIIKYAKVLGANVNSKMSKAQICKAIEMSANKARPKPKSPPVSAANLINSAKSNNLNRLLTGSASSNNLNRLLTESAKSNSNNENLNALLASVRKGNSNDENFNYFLNLADKLKKNNR